MLNASLPRTMSPCGARLRWMIILVISTLAFIWVAAFNRYPLIFTDTTGYVMGFRTIFTRFAAGEYPLWDGVRSFYYGLFTAVLHMGRSLWPVVVAQSLLLTCALLMVYRVLFPRLDYVWFLVVVLVLGLSSSAPWFVAAVMPDIFASITILMVFVIGFHYQSLDRRTLIGAMALLCFSVAAHASHLLLACGLLLATLAVRLSMGVPRKALRTSAILLGLPIATAIVGLLLSSYVLFGHLALSPASPPFFLARSIADGPARAYLQQNCHKRDFALCAFVNELPTDADGLMWGSKSIRERVSIELWQQITSEEMDIVFGAIAQFPLLQLHSTALNWGWQITVFGLSEFNIVHNEAVTGNSQTAKKPWLLDNMKKMFANEYGNFLKSRQMLETLPFNAFTNIQYVGVVLSLMICIFFYRRAKKRREYDLLAFANMIGIGLVMNAIITSTIAGPYPRYQARVAWLLILLATFFLFAARTHRASVQPEGR